MYNMYFVLYILIHMYVHITASEDLFAAGFPRKLKCKCGKQSFVNLLKAGNSPFKFSNLLAGEVQGVLSNIVFFLEML